MYQNTSYMGLEIILCNLNNISLLSILRVRETVFYYRFSIVKLFLCIHDGTLAATHLGHGGRGAFLFIVLGSKIK